MSSNGLQALRYLPWRRHDLDEKELAAIREARDDGATWADIANAMGLDSPQAAQQRHHRLEDRITRAQSDREGKLTYRPASSMD